MKSDGTSDDALGICNQLCHHGACGTSWEQAVVMDESQNHSHAPKCAVASWDAPASGGELVVCLPCGQSGCGVAEEPENATARNAHLVR
eukprot:1007361-Amphidinium_carterae.1